MNGGADAVFDRLDELCGDDDGFRDELLSSFLAESDKDLARLSVAMKAGDATAGQALAHLVKGSCATMGADSLAARCRAIEAALRAGISPADLGDLVAAAEEDWAALRVGLAATRSSAV